MLLPMTMRIPPMLRSWQDKPDIRSEGDWNDKEIEAINRLGDRLAKRYHLFYPIVSLFIRVRFDPTRLDLFRNKNTPLTKVSLANLHNYRDMLVEDYYSDEKLVSRWKNDNS